MLKNSERRDGTVYTLGFWQRNLGKLENKEEGVGTKLGKKKKESGPELGLGFSFNAFFPNSFSQRFVCLSVCPATYNIRKRREPQPTCLTLLLDFSFICLS